MGSASEALSWYQRFEDGEEDVFRCLADGDRRRILGILHDRSPEPITRQDLASHLVPGYRENPGDPELSDAVERKQRDLYHRHLPMLEASGLIAQDSDQDAVTITDHPALADRYIVGVVSDEANADSESLDALFRALAHLRRRSILDVLSHQFGTIHIETLAREIGAKERGVSESAVPTEDVQHIVTNLYHVHLPLLAEAGLIEYDASEGTVAYEGHPELRVPWMHSVFGPDFRESLTDESNSEGVGTIQGREDVVSFGQSICERADEELFCMFTDTNLLEAGCFTRIRDAANRGVTVYLGTRDSTVREYTRENAPEIILWEPETNWLTLPIAGNNVGRLLLADRETVMLGTLGEKTEDGTSEERAIVGEGADNALVVMIAQLLRPYLDQIDDGTEDIESQLPF